MVTDRQILRFFRGRQPMKPSLIQPVFALDLVNLLIQSV